MPKSLMANHNQRVNLTSHTTRLFRCGCATLQQKGAPYATQVTPALYVKRKEHHLRKVILILGFLAFGHSVAYGSNWLSEEKIISSQSAFDAATTAIETSQYLSRDFVFGIAGCKNGEFEAHLVPRAEFLKSIEQINARSNTKKKTIRKNQVIQFSKDKTTAKSESILIEELIEEGKIKVTISEEIGIYVIEEGKLLLRKLMIEIKERHTFKNGEKHITRPSSGCSR
jgi:hypothetical protein